MVSLKRNSSYNHYTINFKSSSPTITHKRTLKIYPDPKAWYYLAKDKEGKPKQIVGSALWELSGKLIETPIDRSYSTQYYDSRSRVYQYGSISMEEDLYMLKFIDDSTVMRVTSDMLREANDKNLQAVFCPISNQEIEFVDLSSLLRFMTSLRQTERDLETESKQQADDRIREALKDDIRQHYLDDNLNVVHEVENPALAELEAIDYMNLEKILQDFTIEKTKGEKEDV